MNQVSISVIAGTDVDTRKFSAPAVGHIEDFSLILMSTSQNGKTYEGGIYVRNSELPLSKQRLDALRVAVNRNMKAMK